MDAAIHERLERARARSVLICSPVARNPVWQYTSSMLSTVQLLAELGIRWGFAFTVGSSVVHRARNELVARFLSSDFSDMLFIDDDMEWSPNSVVRLLGSEQPLIGGVGRMRIQKPNSDPAVWCWQKPPGPIEQDDMGAIRADGFGAAFMLINRGVLFKMAEAHPEWKRPGGKDWPQSQRDNYFEFFAPEASAAGEMSEDLVFCKRWRDLGGKVWVDPEIALGHVGSWTFSGSIAEILENGE